MWSLPDIIRMNSEASQEKEKLERAVRTGILNRKKLTCEWAGHNENHPCEGELRHYLWYDIFSDDPKGILTLCEAHDGYYGRPSEGFFECDDCGRIFTENYTWEMYRADTEDGVFCLPCYAARELSQESNWISLTNEAIDAMTFDDVRKAKHLIGVKMPIPKGIETDDQNNVTFDSMDGHGLNGGVEDFKTMLHRLKDDGHKRAILILDAAYQFAVCVSVYTPAKGGQYDDVAEKVLA